MQYLLFQPKLQEMCITTKGITDLAFQEGWRTAYQDKEISTNIINEYETHGFTLSDGPEYLHEFHVTGRTAALNNLFDGSTDRITEIY